MLKVRCFLLLAVLFAAVYADPKPEEIWKASWKAPGNKAALSWDMAVTEEGFVYVTGKTVDGQPSYSQTVKFSPQGELEWHEEYQLGNWDDYIMASYGLAVDTAGYAYVVGKWGDRHGTRALFADYHLIKYDSAGDTVWSRRWDSGEHDIGRDVALDKQGFIYVTGHSGPQDTTGHGAPENGPYDFYTLKYDSEGNKIWEKKYGYGDKDEQAFGISVDQDGYIYVTGAVYSNEIYGYNFLTIKYDSERTIVWKKFYQSVDGDWAKAVAVDDGGNVYVTGFTGPAEEQHDYLTVKYDSEGNEIWKRFYDNNGYDDKATDIAVDSQGSIYVTGWSQAENDNSGWSVKYDPEGNLCWEMETPLANAIAVDEQGYVYVTSYITMNVTKYRQLLGVEEEPQSLPPILTVDQTVANTARISYQLAEATHLNLSAYDASGRLVTTLIQGTRTAGKHLAHWTPPSPGVYFIRLDTGTRHLTGKFVSVK